MVVFTCNNCGDSVKKPKAEKHVSIECRKKFLPVSFCCVDCLKDFNADTFARHSKCVTELERYSAKGFVPKPSSNKGERKQNSWVDSVRSVLNLPMLSRQQRELLQAITHFDNVPRKKAKFQNFVRSSIRHIRVYPDVADSVFDLLEKTFKETTTTTTTQVATRTDVNIAVSSNGIIQENGHTNGMTSSEETISTSNNINDTQFECNTNQMEEMEKTKRNNKTTNDPVHVAMESDCQEQTPQSTEHEFVIVERKKKKKKKTTKSDNLRDGESVSACVVDNSNGDASVANIETNYECNAAINATDVFDDFSIDCKQISKKKRKKLRLPLDTNIPIGLAQDDNASGSETVSVAPGSAEETTNDTTVNDTQKHNHCRIIETVSLEGSNDRKTKKKRDRKHADVAPESNVDLRIAEELQKNGANELGARRKKKRKLTPNDDDETSVSTSKKTKLIESTDAYGNENYFNGCNKFVWEDVIKSLLSKSSDEGVSLKKMTKKIVNEYQRSFPNRSYDEIAKKLNKKMNKLPFVIVHKERVKLRT